MLDEIFDTLQTVCLGCDYYVTIECAQMICAPLLQNATERNATEQNVTEVRRFSAHTRNRCVMKITKYPDVLALRYCPLFNTHFAIDFSERAIQGNIDRSILLTAKMGRYGVKVALLRCLIRLIIFNITPARKISIGVHVKKASNIFSISTSLLRCATDLQKYCCLWNPLSK